jgi:hypothetical protein
MQASSTRQQEAVTVAAVAAVVAEILTAPLPLPGLVTMHPGHWPNAAFQFSPTTCGEARFTHLREWASHYDAPVTSTHLSAQTVFTVEGIEFTVYAPYE